MNKPRITWIDTARGISIFLVVLGHTILPYSWMIYIFSFHMPLFFFLSGYLFNGQKQPNFWAFTARRATTLLVPYLIFFLINYIYWLARFGSQNYLEPVWQMLYSTDKLHAPFIPLWFLTCLFLVEIYFYILFKLPKKILPFMIGLSLIAGLLLGSRGFRLPWGVDIALVSTFFFYIGFLIKKYTPQISKIKITWLTSIGLLMIIANYFLAFANSYQVTMLYRAYGNFPIYVFASITGALGYLIIFKRLKETLLKKISIFEFLGQNSVIILGLHTIGYYTVSDFFKYQLDLAIKDDVIYSFVFSTLTICLIVPIIYLINAKLPFLIGRQKKTLASDPL